MLRYWSNLSRHELYDLEQDRGERQRRDRASIPRSFRSMKADYARWYQGTRSPMGWGEEVEGLAPRASDRLVRPSFV